MRLPALIAPAAVFALVTMASTARAAFIGATDLHFGLDSVTIDTSTGLTWLDLNFTAGRSFVDVAGELGPGGDFAGYRHATRAEVLHLFDEFGFLGPGVAPGATDAFFALFGQTGDQAGHPEARGWAADALTAPWNIFGLDFFFDNPDAYEIYRGESFWQSPTTTFDGTGNWLVVPVPEPSTLLLFGTGLIGVVGLLKRARGIAVRA